MTSRVFSVARFGQQKIIGWVDACVVWVLRWVWLKQQQRVISCLLITMTFLSGWHCSTQNTQLLHFVPMDTFFVNAYHLPNVDFTDGHLTSIEARTSPIYYWKIFKKRQFLSQAFFWLKSLFLYLGILAWDLTNLKAIRTLLSEQIAPLNHFSFEPPKPLLNPFRRHTPYVTISMPYCDV